MFVPDVLRSPPTPSRRRRAAASGMSWCDRGAGPRRGPWSQRCLAPHHPTHQRSRWADAAIAAGDTGTGWPLLAAERSGGYDPAAADGAAAADAAAEREVPAAGPEVPAAEQGAARGTDGFAAITGALAAVADQLRRTAEEEPGRTGMAQVDAALAALADAERALAAVRARLVGCARRSQVAGAAGAADTGAYLRSRLGVSARAAKQHAELAADLALLPATFQALVAGRIGVEQAAAVGRAARAGHLGSPTETEHALLDAACTCSPEELGRRIRRLEQELERDGQRLDESRARQRRRVSLARRGDGLWELSGLLDPVAGETVATALHGFSVPDAPGTPLGQRRRPEQRAADALLALAQAGLASGAPKAGGVRPQLTVVVPLASLLPGGHAPGQATFGTLLSPETVQRLACDAGVSWLIGDGGTQVLAAGRTTREWNAAQRRALAAIHGGCRGPHCDRPIVWCDIHHVRWWSRGGTTDLDNGLPLCDHHHALLHEGGWHLDHDPATGRATFTSPTGTVVTTWPRGVESPTHGPNPTGPLARPGPGPAVPDPDGGVTADPSRPGAARRRPGPRVQRARRTRDPADPDPPG